MTGYEAYELFQALKRHFTQEKFDFFKYRGHINTSKEACLLYTSDAADE